MYHVDKMFQLDEAFPDYQMALVSTYGTYPIDRFDFMERPSFLELHPDSVYLPKRNLDSFGTVCINRAKELLERPEKLAVYWSGGIDSMVVMVALIQAGAKWEDLVVIMDKRSLVESYHFYRDHIIGKFETVPFKQAPEMIKTTDYLLVTGELGDHLFGTEGAQRVIWQLGWQGIAVEGSGHNFVKAMVSIGNKPEHMGELYRNIRGSAAKAGVTLNTVFDHMWWICYAFKWQTVLMRMFMYGDAYWHDQLTVSDYGRLEHFFKTHAFQDWACTGHEPKLGENWSEYKLPAKRFVHRFWDNQDWFQHAVKLPSLKNNVKFEPGHVLKSWPPGEVEKYARK